MHKLDDSLNAGASDEEIRFFENEQGITLPEIFVKLYRHFNGQNQLLPENQPRWLALEEIVQRRHEWRAACKRYYGAKWTNVTVTHFGESHLVKNRPFNDFWLPFMIDSEGVFCLDYDPTPLGKEGQVIYVKVSPQLEDSCIIHLANDAHSWFMHHAEAKKSEEIFDFQANFVSFLRRMIRADDRSLYPPIGDTEIRIWEKKLAVTFPDKLKEIWHCFNGEAPNDDYLARWIPIQEWESERQNYQQILRNLPNITLESFIAAGVAEDENLDENHYFHQRWFPLVQIGEVIVFLDFAPKERGFMGQVLLIALDDQGYELLACFASFDEWLFDFLYRKLDHVRLSLKLSLQENTFLPLTAHLLAHYEGLFGTVSESLISDNRAGGLFLFGGREGFDYHVAATFNVSATKLSAPLPDNDLPYQRVEFFIFLPPDWPIDYEEMRQQKKTWPLAWLDYYGEHIQRTGEWVGMETVPIPYEVQDDDEPSPFSAFLLVDSEKVFGEQQFSLFQNPVHAEKTQIRVMLPLFAAEYEAILRAETPILNQLYSFDWLQSCDANRQLLFNLKTK